MEYSIKNKDLSMKKILFCIAAAALVTACTNEDDLVVNQDNSRAKGLTFDVTLAEGATTRGEIWKDENGKYPFFWYAETDRINVHAIHVEAGSSNNTPNGNATVDGAGIWTLQTNGASYKATKSAGAGQFTAADDANMLLLKDYDAKDIETTATIVATYGDVKAKSVTSEVDKTQKAVPGELTSLVLSTTAGNASQTVARANVVAAPMYSISTGVKEEVYNSLGEKANLKLIRPFPIIRFTTKNTKEYISDFGELKSVELTAQGTKKDGGAEDVKASDLAYDNGKDFTVIGATTGFGASYAIGSNSNVVKVELTDGTWTDNDAVYMTVAPVNRKAFRDKGQKEPLKVEYAFEKITFTLDATREGATEFEKALQTSSDWTATDANGNPNAVTPLPSLDINNYNYLVTNETSGGANDRTLIVLKGNFKDIFNENGDAVVWSAAAAGEATVTSFKKIISNVALTNEELATVKKFTNLTDLTLKENTTIPANTFTTGQATAITNLNLPKVASIDEKFINGSGAFAALETLIMPAYEFTNAAVNKAFFNDDVKNALTTIDMSGVTSMMPTFGIERTMVFTGYAALVNVTVKDNVVVSPSGFAGCTALETITGKLDISQASNAFDMNSAPNNALRSVEVNSTELPNDAFNNCTALETVNYNGSAIVPTAIGANAFASAVAMKYMDLSKAATIGASAFKGSGLISTNKSVSTLTVGATELPASIFENCTELKMVKFTAATKITGADIFKGASKVIQIKFEKVITLADGANDGDYKDVFSATPENIDFWTNPSQPGVAGSKLTLSYKNGSTTYNQDYTFKSIQKKLD